MRTGILLALTADETQVDVLMVGRMSAVQEEFKRRRAAGAPHIAGFTKLAVVSTAAVAASCKFKEPRGSYEEPTFLTDLIEPTEPTDPGVIELDGPNVPQAAEPLAIEPNPLTEPKPKRKRNPGDGQP